MPLRRDTPGLAVGRDAHHVVCLSVAGLGLVASGNGPRPLPSEMVVFWKPLNSGVSGMRSIEEKVITGDDVPPAAGP